MKFDFFNNPPPNFFSRIVIPLGISIFSGLCFFNISGLKYLGLGVTIPFTITKAFLDGWAIEFSNKNIKKREHLVHCKYALSKISHVTTVLNNPNYENRVQAESIGELEVILTDVWKCCFEDEKSKFQEHKGLVGDYKTALQKSNFDPSIKPNITRFIGDLHKIETFLREKT